MEKTLNPAPRGLDIEDDITGAEPFEFEVRGETTRIRSIRMAP